VSNVELLGCNWAAPDSVPSVPRSTTAVVRFAGCGSMMPSEASIMSLRRYPPQILSELRPGTSGTGQVGPGVRVMKVLAPAGVAPVFDPES